MECRALSACWARPSPLLARIAQLALSSAQGAAAGAAFEAHLSLSDRLSQLRLVVHGDGLDLDQAALGQVLDGEGGASRRVRGEICSK